MQISQWVPLMVACATETNGAEAASIKKATIFVWTYVTTSFDILFLSFFIGINGYYFTLISLAILEISKRKATRLPELDSEKMESRSLPPIAILVPAYNEQEVIETTIRALLATNYPQIEIIVINDGSTDETAQTLIEKFDLVPTDRVIHEQFETEEIRDIYRADHFEETPIVFVDKENGGKSDALNAGINASRYPLICSIDADTLVAEDAFLRLVEPFIYNPNQVVAVGGTVRISNGCKIYDDHVEFKELPDSWLVRFQIIEYLRAFIFGRMGLNRLKGNFIISGAFGLYNKDTVVDIGGYNTDTVGEDMDLVVRLHRYIRQEGREGRVIQIPEPVCYTEVPSTFETLGNQRDRWHRGLAESL